MALKFSTAYAVLLVACAGVALVVPAAVVDRVRGPVSLLFWPIAKPTTFIATTFAGRVSPERGGLDPTAPQTPEDIKLENAALRAELVSLQRQLIDLQKLNTDRADLGPVRERAVAARVMGTDPGPGGIRQVLSVTLPAAGAKVAERMPAVSPQGLVGRVTSVGLSAARVVLTTDDEFKLQCAFVRFVPTVSGTLQPTYLGPATLLPLVKGARGKLRITNLARKDIEAAGIRAGDWVVVNDDDFPPSLQGFRVGYVTEVQAVTPLWSEITAAPSTDLLRLKELMIVTHP